MRKTPSNYTVNISQSGLGLPDRDYYLKDDDAKLKAVRAKYQKHIETMLAMSGDKDAAAHAAQIARHRDPPGRSAMDPRADARSGQIVQPRRLRPIRRAGAGL